MILNPFTIFVSMYNLAWFENLYHFKFYENMKTSSNSITVILLMLLTTFKIMFMGRKQKINYIVYSHLTFSGNQNRKLNYIFS